MTQERIEIVVSVSGARTVRRQIDDIGSGAKGASDGLTLLKRALATLGGAAIIRRLAQTADAFTNIRNRLRLVTESTNELNVVTDELFRISQRTRSDFEANAEVFNRVALSTKELGISQKETLQFTEDLNKAVAISGASAIEAKAGLIQLSQGLASGALRGDELRSVLEQLPKVADVIAKGLGVTRGELRKLGEQGKITAGDILESFKKASSSLAEQFKNIRPTLGQAFSVLGNAFTKLIGDLNESKGFTADLAQGIIYLADNLEDLAKAAAVAGAALLTAFAPRVLLASITKITSAVRALTLAMAANPIGAFLVALTSITTAAVLFGDEIKAGTDTIATLEDVATTAIDNVVSVFQALWLTIQDIFPGFSALIDKTFGDFEFSIFGALRAFGRWSDTILKLGRATFSAYIEIWRELPTYIADLFKDALNSVLKLTEKTINSLIDGVNSVRQFFGNNPFQNISIDTLETSGKSLGAKVAEKFNEGLLGENVISNSVEQFIKQVEQNAAKRLEDKAQSAANANSVDLSAPRAGASRQETARFTQKQLDVLRKLNDQLKNERNLIFLTNEEREIQNDLLKIQETLKKNNINLTNEEIQKIEEVVRANKSLETSFEKIKEIGENAFSAIEDSLVDFVKTGKLSFSNLVDGILSDLTRLATQQFITNPLSNIFTNVLGSAFSSSAPASSGGGSPFGLGSVLSSIGSFFGFAEGGSFKVGGTGGTDSQLVAFKASPNETVDILTPAQRAAEKGGGGVVVNVINNAPGTEARAQERSDGRGGKSIDVVVDEITSRNLRNFGSESNKTIRNMFGINPITQGR